jgi:hypothetical protein
MGWDKGWGIKKGWEKEKTDWDTERQSNRKEFKGGNGINRKKEKECEKKAMGKECGGNVVHEKCPLEHSPPYLTFLSADRKAKAIYPMFKFKLHSTVLLSTSAIMQYT